MGVVKRSTFCLVLLEMSATASVRVCFSVGLAVMMDSLKKESHL